MEENVNSSAPSETKTFKNQKYNFEEYPSLATRFKAMIVDGLMIITGFFLAGVIFSIFEDAPGYARGIAFVFIIFLYEPILVSFGGTIGHRANGMIVKSHANTDKNIFFLLAILRSLIKWFLGWISFITIINGKEKRAIHDLASNSIVLYKKRI